MDFDVNCIDESKMRSRDVSLMAHGIRQISQIPLHEKLLSINFHSNEIERINGLTRLNCLTHLDLSSNKIKRIEGLQGLISLDTLNLASNQISIVEGFISLKKLSWLNLSYNQIEYLQGFQDVWGDEYNLTIIQIHGNQIDSLDQIVKHLNGLSRLKHLTLRQNPVSKTADCRLKIFNQMKTLLSLDGIDRHGEKEMNSQQLTGIEQYVQINSNSTNQFSDVPNSICDQYPKIAAALNALRHDPKSMESSTTTSFDIHNESIQPMENDSTHRGASKIISRRQITNDKRSARSPSSENESDSMPSKSTRLKQRSTTSNPPVHSSSRQQPMTTKKMSSQIPSSLNNYSSETTNIVQTKSANLIHENTRPFINNSHLFNTTNQRDSQEYSYQNDHHEDIHEIYRVTLRDLDVERDRRWRAEQKIKDLNQQIEQNQKTNNDGRTDETILRQLTQKHQQRLNDEKSKFEDLTKILEDYKTRLRSSEDQLSSYKKAQETNLQLIKTLESGLSQIETEKSELTINQNEKIRNSERRLNLFQQENEKLQQDLQIIKEQLRQCQELYTTTQIQHKKQLNESKIDVQSNEVQQYLQQQIQQIQINHQTELTNQQQKLQTLAIEYNKLEQEFRDALQIEQRRYEQIYKTNEITQKENELLQSTSTNIKQREQSDRKITNDLIILVREQKQRLQETAKTNQTLTNQNKHLTNKLERAIEQLKTIREQILLLQNERREIDARLVAQESILAGLRQEKQLWSQELAHQGASLAQDRGRLESTIQTLQSEVNTLKKQLDKQVDTSRIKQTIIESQLDTIQKLKDGVVERDETIKKGREDLLIRQNELEQQLQDQQFIYEQLKEKYDKTCEKRDSMKNDFHQVQQQLEKSQTDYNALSRKWKEKSDLITELDTKIRRAAENYQINEKKLSDENERLIEKQKELDEKLRHRDDDFRRQLETIEHGHRQTFYQMKNNYEEKIAQAQSRVTEVEDEMRRLLIDTNETKKKWEERVKHFNTFINHLQDPI